MATATMNQNADWASQSIGDRAIRSLLSEPFAPQAMPAEDTAFDTSQVPNELVDEASSEPSLHKWRQVSKSCLREIYKHCSSNGSWNKELSMEGVTVHSKSLTGMTGSKALKAEIILPYNPEIIWRLIHRDIHLRRRWDGTVTRHRLIEMVDDTTDVVYTAENAIGPFSARDFVDVTGWHRLESGQIVVGGASVDHAAVPEMKGIVRGRNGLRGYLLTSCCQGKYTQLSYLSQSDLGGWMPNKVVEAVGMRTMVQHLLNLKQRVDANRNRSQSA